MKDNIVLVLSSGFGHIINEMILYKTLSQKYNVDVFINEPFAGISKLFKGNIYGYVSYPPQITKKYIGKVETLWGKDSRVKLPLLIQDVDDLYKNVSEIEGCVRVAKKLGVDNIIWDLDLNYDYEQHFDIVVANTSRDFKIWDWKRYPYYNELADLLNKKYSVCSIGSKNEYVKGTVDKTGLPIIQSAGLIKNSNLVITNESGIYHLANALKVNNLVLLGGSSFKKIYDERFHKYSIFIYKEKNITFKHIRDKKLLDINVDIVAQQAEKLLKLKPRKEENEYELSVIILCKKNVSFTKRCLESLAHLRIPHQTILVDNIIKDGTELLVDKHLKGKDDLYFRDSTDFVANEKIIKGKSVFVVSNEFDFKGFNVNDRDKFVEKNLFIRNNNFDDFIFMSDTNIKIASPQDLKIGICKAGGIGDTIESILIARKIREKYPHSKITLFLRDEEQKKILDMFPNIADSVGFTRGFSWNDFVTKKIKEFDLFYDLRYIPKIFYNCDKERTKVYEEWFKQYTKYYKSWKEASKFIMKQNMSRIETSIKMLGLNFNEEDYYLPKIVSNFNLPKKPYIVFHHGADGGYKTKNWLADGWNEVITWVKKKYYTVQIGILTEEPLQVDLDLRGKTNIRDLFYILSEAKLLCDTEGGMVHIAHTQKTRSLVLFGSTPVKAYGYKDNINIVKNICPHQPCWWQKPNWDKKCYLTGKNIAKCMQAIKISDVIKELKNVI